MRESICRCGTVHRTSRGAGPEGPNPPLWLAILYLDLGREAQTAGLIEAARKHWPGDVAVDYLSAIVEWNRGDLGAAERHAGTLLERYPSNPEMLAIVRDADLQAFDYQAARSRYAEAYPELLAPPPPRIDGTNCFVAINLVPVLQKIGEIERAGMLLDLSEQVVRTIPRLGVGGHGIADVRIFALRGQRKEALVALQDAEKAGWRLWWRYAATSTRASPRSATSPNSNRSSPTSSATWRGSEPNSPPARRVQRSNLCHPAKPLAHSTE